MRESAARLARNSAIFRPKLKKFGRKAFRATKLGA
jgi:hypothetical protein